MRSEREPGGLKRAEQKSRKKLKKVLKKVLTSGTRCDIIVESPRERYREGLRRTANRSLKIEQQEIEEVQSESKSIVRKKIS